MVSALELFPLEEKTSPSATAELPVAPSTTPPVQSRSALDLFPLEPPKVAPSTEPPVAEPPKVEKSSEELFYGSHAAPIPVQGLMGSTWSPAIAAEVGKRGYGPKVMWSESGVPLDKDGNPFYKPEKAEGIIAETLQGFSTLLNPKNLPEITKGVGDFILSIPGFLVGVLGAASRGGKELADQIALGNTLNLLDVYNAASKGMQESFEFFQPGKELILGKPSETSALPAEVAMAPMSAISTGARQISESKIFEGYPNIQGAIRFTGDLLALTTMGFLLHGGARKSFSEKIADVNKQAQELAKLQEALDQTPDSILKNAEQAGLDAKKAQLDLVAQQMLDEVGGDITIREQLDSIAEAAAKKKLRPIAVKGIKMPTKAQIRDLMDKMPEGTVPDFTFTSKKGNVYVKSGDTWYDADRRPVTNSFIIKAAEKGKSEVGAEPTPAEPVAEPKPEPKPGAEPISVEALTKYAQEEFNMSPDDARDFAEKEMVSIDTGEPADLYGYKGKKIRTMEDYKEYFKWLEESDGGKTAPKLTEEEIRELEKELEEEFPEPDTTPASEEQIRADLAQIKDIEDYFGKKINEVTDEEIEAYFEEAYTGEPIDPNIDPVPEMAAEQSQYYQTPEETATNKALYENNKSVNEDFNVFFMKLVNDVNRWYHGEDLPIDQIRNGLRNLAMNADELDFLTNYDKLLFKESVDLAVEWADKLDRSKIEPSAVTLNSMVPLEMIPQTVHNFITQSAGGAKTMMGYLKRDAVALKTLYRNKELFQKTGFWLGRDLLWRYEIDDTQMKIDKEKIKQSLGNYLENVIDNPKLFEAVPRIRKVRIALEPGYAKGEGSYNPNSQTILIGSTDTETVIHEIQHAIQNTINEAFKGSSIEISEALAKMEHVADMLDKLVDVGKTLEVKESAKMIADQTRSKIEAGNVDYNILNNFYKYVNGLTESELSYVDRANFTPPRIDGYAKYKTVPGEMEARVVEKRLKMSRVERRKTAPWETLDQMLTEEGLSSEEYYTPSGDKVSRSIKPGTKLYSGLSPEEIVKSGKAFAEYVNQATAIKSFKPKEAAKRAKEAFVRAFIDRSGNIRKRLLEHGKGGYETVQAMVTAKGASAKAAEALRLLRRGVYKGLSANEVKILDRVILADRLIDIAKYKTPKQFSFPQPIENIVRFRKAFQLKQINTFEDLPAHRAALLEQRAKIYSSWMQKALKDLFDEGLITEKEYNDLAVHNYRKIKLVEEAYDGKYKTTLGGKKRTVHDSGIESLARGKKTDIYEPSSEVMALEVMNRTYGRILNNRANLELLNMARQDRNNPFVRVRISNKDKIPGNWSRLEVMEDGERKSFYVSPEMAEEWITSGPMMKPQLATAIRMISGSPILRTFATGINWGFAVANMPKDIMHAWFAARIYDDRTKQWKPVYNTFAPTAALQMGRDIVTTFSDALLRKGAFQDYIDEGGGMEFLTAQGRLFQRGRHLESELDKFYNFMGYFGETSEIATRLAIRERALRQIAKREGMKLKDVKENKKFRREATFVARDYMDFGQGGWLTKAMDQGIPYLNASVQGTRGLWRSFKDNPVRSALKLTQFASVVTGLYILMRKSRPLSTQALQGSVDMQNNICIPLGDSFGFEDERGQMHYPYIKIPLDPGQKFFKTLFEAATDKWLGNDIDVDTVTGALKQFSPVSGASDVLSPTLSAALGYTTNKDFWLNEEIWKQTDKPFGYPESQHEWIPGRTPQAMVDFGKATGMSPERTKYAVEELVTSGTVWSYLAGLGYDKAFGNVPKEKRQQHLAMTLARMPVIKRFFGVTNPYSQHAGTITEAEQNSAVNRWVQKQGLRALTDDYLFNGNVKKDEINRYMRSFKDYKVFKRLKEDFEFQVKTKKLPNRSFWIRLKGLNNEARAEVYVKEFDSASPAKREQLLKEQAEVYRMGGVITPDFRTEVSKLRSRPKE